MNSERKTAAALQSTLVALVLGSFWLANAFGAPSFGIPEPGLIIYGAITDSNGLPYVPSSPLRWDVASGGTSVGVTSTIACVNGVCYHVAQVPFETRLIAGTTNFPASSNTFELTSGQTTYGRTAWVGSNRLFLTNPGLGSFTFSKSERGREDRVDLRLPYSVANVDSDGDGMPDWAEIIAGTDPHDPNSVLRLSGQLSPSPSGGLVIQWVSVPGTGYTVFSTTNLANPFRVLTTNVVAGSVTTSFRDAEATGLGPYFYRIRVNTPANP